MCREEMIRKIVEALDEAKDIIVEQMYWLLMEEG